MGADLPPRPFAIDEAQFLDELRRLSSDSEGRKLWVYLESNVASLLATGCRIQVSGRSLRLLPPQKAPEDLPHTGILFYLPATSVWGRYERRFDGKGNVRLSLAYELHRMGDDNPMEVQLVVATSEEFVTVAKSEAQLQ